MYPGSSYTEKHHIAIELNVLYSVEVIRNSVEPTWPIIGGNKKRFTQAAAYDMQTGPFIPGIPGWLL